MLLSLGLDDIIQNELGISVSIANPFGHISLGSKVNPQALGNDAPGYVDCKRTRIEGILIKHYG